MCLTRRVSTTQITLLGAIAGFTIFLGLPVGRLRNLSIAARTLLNAVAIGILVFLLFDVLAHVNEPIETRLKEAATGDEGWSSFIGLVTVAVVGLGIGLLSLVYFERRALRRGSITADSIDETSDPIPATDHSGGPTLVATRSKSTASSATQLAFLIAAGIGLHNFAEGLAIGQSAVQGDVALATLLIVGFALHNATEGFGIVAPLAGGDNRPSWATLGLLGIIGGGPTLLGTIVGQTVTSDTLYVAFLALAAGSILYVALQLANVAAKARRSDLLGWGVMIGLIAGFATDYVLVVAGT